jgi:hypothetical protein
VHSRTEAGWNAAGWSNESSSVAGSSNVVLVEVEAAVEASQGRGSERGALDERSSSGGRASRRAHAETAARKVVDGERSGSVLGAGHPSTPVAAGLKGPRSKPTEPRLAGHVSRSFCATGLAERSWWRWASE